MSIKPIKSEEDHKAAMQRIDVLWSKKDQASRDELEVLGMLVSAYEDEAIPVDDVDPIDMVRFRMEQAGFTQPDLSSLLGSRSRATEILNKKRPLTLSMIRVLHFKWKIPADALIKEPQARKPKPKARRGKKKSPAPARARASRAPIGAAKSRHP
jgi:HTH-type transcriptional regulator / antitoxin HigA